MEKNNLLQESLKRHRELLGYDPSKGTSSLNERSRHTYLADDTDYAEGDEEETKEGGEEEGGDNPDFDFGGEEGAEEGTEEGFGDEGTEETDEFGTADEFSAVDDIETEDAGEEVEEIDVTDIVKKSEDAKSYSEKAVKAAEEGKNMIQDLMSKFDALQSSLSKIDTVAHELNTIKADIQSQKPKEKLELRSLDSYPFNVKLTDYWNDEKLKSNYEINGGKPDAESQDGGVKVWKLDPNEAKDYSNVDIKKSFVPESRSKKKVLTENTTLKDVIEKKGGLNHFDNIKDRVRLKLIDGEFVKKNPEWKNKPLKFLFYNSREGLVGIELIGTGKSGSAYPKELIIDTEQTNMM